MYAVIAVYTDPLGGNHVRVFGPYSNKEKARLAENRIAATIERRIDLRAPGVLVRACPLHDDLLAEEFGAYIAYFEISHSPTTESST